jgi:hypothetical protein
LSKHRINARCDHENIYHPEFLCDILVRKLDLIQKLATEC